MFNFTGKKYIFFAISGAIILLGLLSLTTFGRLRLGIEFSSGSLMRISFGQEVIQEDLKDELISLGYTNTIIQSTLGGDFYIRTDTLSDDDKITLKSSLEERFGKLEETEFSTVSPMIASETARNAAIAVAVAAIGILLYVTWAFHRMPNPFRYGICAIIALIHDTLVTLGIFSILASFLGWEINLMFITGILAVIGYSINNTVVIFDRIRENLGEGTTTEFELVVNNSLVETISRSLNTSLTTLIVAVALLLFVGASILNFAVVLLIGIIAGTYSSLFIAPLLLVAWERKRRENRPS
jgi:preprotein translocase subunit SecF